MIARTFPKALALLHDLGACQMAWKSSAIGLLLLTGGHAATTVSETWNVSTTIPDNNPLGLADTRNVVTDITEIAEISVQLVTSGGWNGDLYAYLVHDSGLSVLLNRPGRSAGAPDGSSGVGMMITLSDLASGDVHLATADPSGLIGAYQPDGRATDPGNALDTDSRTAMLSSFSGLDANGSWTLFVADLGAGDTATLETWTLNITGVPEPSAGILLCLATATFLWRRKRH